MTRAQLEHVILASAMLVEDDEIIVTGIGEGSPFHETFGYYAQGVDEKTAVLPSGWKDRLVPVRGEGTRGATGWCLEIHDLVVAKLVAGREKDLDFTAVAARHALVRQETLQARLAGTEIADALRAIVAARIGRIFNS